MSDTSWRELGLAAGLVLGMIATCCGLVVSLHACHARRDAALRHCLREHSLRVCQEKGLLR